MQLTLQYPPSCNRYWRTFRGRQVVSAQARAYRSHVAATAFAAGKFQPINGPVSIHAVLQPHKPKRASSSPVRCMDLDNAMKVLIDSLQGIAYENDRQVVEIHLTRGEPITGGAIAVTVEPAK